jgi:hypothetical protein
MLPAAADFLAIPLVSGLLLLILLLLLLLLIAAAAALSRPQCQLLLTPARQASKLQHITYPHSPINKEFAACTAQRF